jgi:16S rRNA (guanine966-N2)-methyltransferase
MAGKPRAKNPAKGATHPRGAQSRRLRIIAGRWRGRRWQFPDGEIRPTSDRVRETLFNWLQDRVASRRCLDLYSGSGALGLEALSRGADHCVFVDHNASAIAALADVMREWGASSGMAELIHSDAQRFLATPSRAFGLVFLDPPFAGAELAASVAKLSTGGWLSPGALVYIEHPRASALPTLPDGWQMLRHSQAGAVGYDLYEIR